MKCDLCNKATVHSGKDKLLYEDEERYIVDNGNTGLKENGTCRKFNRRITLVIRAHQSGYHLSKYSREWLRLERYVEDVLRVDSEVYFIRKTMNTYPGHFHIHAYIYPEVTK